MRRIVIIILLISAGVVLFFIPNEDRINMPVVVVGLGAPDFELPELDPSGKNPSRIWRLSDLMGKVVFINFWASWCEECKKEKPSMQRLYEMMQGKPFQTITILYRDNPEKAMAYMKKNGFTMPVLLDVDQGVSHSYGVNGVPETFIIDREGVLRKKTIGRGEWDSPDTLGFIENLLK